MSQNTTVGELIDQLSQFDRGDHVALHPAHQTNNNLRVKRIGSGEVAIYDHYISQSDIDSTELHFGRIARK